MAERIERARLRRVFAMGLVVLAFAACTPDTGGVPGDTTTSTSTSTSTSSTTSTTTSTTTTTTPTQPNPNRGTALGPNGTLTAGQYLESGDGRYKLLMQPDGNLVLYTPGYAIWSTGTAGTTGAWAIMQPDGNFVLYRANNTAAWSVQTGSANATIGLQPDGNLVLRNTAGTALWSTGTYSDKLVPGDYLKVGQYLRSPDGRFQLLMQPDGNLVLYGPTGARWSTGSAGSAGIRVDHQLGDGNVVLYRANGSAVWNSGAAGAGSQFIVQSDGNLVLYRSNGTLVWQSNTSEGVAPGGVDGSAYPANNATDCSGQFGIYSWCINGNWLSGRGYAYRNCTDWVSWRLQTGFGVADAKVRGLGHGGWWSGLSSIPDAVAWRNANGSVQSRGIVVNSTPSVGAAAVVRSTSSNYFGHVAVIESVSGSTITVSEFNKGGTGLFGTRSGTLASLGFTDVVHF